MLPDEYRAAGELAGEGYGRVVADIGATHQAVADRVFGMLGEGAGPVRVAHDAIAGVAYGATRLIGRGLLWGAGQAAALVPQEAPRSLDTTSLGRGVRGALSGAFGDRLAARGNPLAVQMNLRPVGERGPRIAVFLHGLCETSDGWGLGGRPTYGDRLRLELGYTPVYVDYNSGLHVSDNGRRLCAGLTALLEQWPVEVQEIVLVGHSMGGLINRSACHYGEGSTWVGRVRHVIALGTPHAGAPLERAAHAAAWRLRQLPETRAFGEALDGRSVGIKDLYYGYLTDECWGGQDPAQFLRNAASQIPFLRSAEHYFVSSSLARDHDHRIGRHFGDLLVLHQSAWGSMRPGERLAFDVDHYRHIGGASHFHLLNHPLIAEQLVRWLSPKLLCATAHTG